jgi:uncharacterized protein (DUF58 family)
MWRHDKLEEAASPVRVTQSGLIRLSAPARVLSLDALRINSLQTGAYVSRFKGRGMEFDESRPYQPGDDPRSIDWRVTARSTDAYTKLFREERERPVFVLVDLRSDMHFATRGSFKSVGVSQAAALLAWAAQQRGDRLGGLIFGDTTQRELKPRLGRQAALHFVHELVNHPDWNSATDAAPANGEAQFQQALAVLRRVARPGSLIIVLSDFSGFTATAQSYLAGVARHNEVLVVFSSDPLEHELPPPGRYRIVSDDRSLEIDTHGNKARQEYVSAFNEKHALLERFCRRYSIHLLPLSTTEDPIAKLQQVLGRRVN